MAMSREGGGLPKGGGFTWPTVRQLKTTKATNEAIKARGGNVKLDVVKDTAANRAKRNSASEKKVKDAKSGKAAKKAAKEISDYNKDSREVFSIEAPRVKIDSRTTGGITGPGAAKINKLYRQMDKD